MASFNGNLENNLKFLIALGNLQAHHRKERQLQSFSLFLSHVTTQIFQKKRSFYQNDDKIRKFANIGFT